MCSGGGLLSVFVRQGMKEEGGEVKRSYAPRACPCLLPTSHDRRDVLLRAVYIHM